MRSVTDVIPRVMRESLSNTGADTEPGFEALKCVRFTAAHAFHRSSKSHPNLAYPPYCSNPISLRWPSLRLYDAVATLEKRPDFTRFEASVCKVLKDP